MKPITHVRTPQERLAVRREGELRARRVFLQAVAIVSILRTALTAILPLAGSSAWWVTLGCLLPGLTVFGALALAMRLTGTETLPELMRRCLGSVGGWLVSILLTALLLLDGSASMTALITLFTEGVGTRGTQLTLAILTGGALLFSLHREGLPRAVYLLRYVLLAAALTPTLYALPTLRADSLFPLLGDGRPALTTAFCAGGSMTWPLLLLLTLPEKPACTRIHAACPVVLAVLLAMLFVCLTAPHELLIRRQALAECLLLPAYGAPSAVQTLTQCLLILAFFYAIGGAAQLSTDFLCAPMGRPPRWLPYGILALLTATQALNTVRLWSALAEILPWLLLPLAALAALCLPIAIIRRKRT